MNKVTNTKKTITGPIKHCPVLVQEVLQLMEIKPGETYLDVTFGGGGHARAILEAAADVKIIGLDWDKKSLASMTEVFTKDFGDRVKLIWGNFAHLYRLASAHKLPKVNGILADFGTSQHQIFNYDGFSFAKKTPLDMRMSQSHSFYTAADVVNTFPKERLLDIFFTLGEEPSSRIITEEILAYRTYHKILFADQLAEIIMKAKGGGRGKIHPATKVFQALRMFVNREIENIQSFLAFAPSLLAKDGRLLCISFHSLEDRLVKDFFRTQATNGAMTLLTKKPIMASEAEVKLNPSARSAKLRGARRQER